jgi:hypothetical protein
MFHIKTLLEEDQWEEKKKEERRLSYFIQRS